MKDIIKRYKFYLCAKTKPIRILRNLSSTNKKATVFVPLSDQGFNGHFIKIKKIEMDYIFY